MMLGSSPLVDALGMAAGHAYYFLEDVYPRMVSSWADRRLTVCGGLGAGWGMVGWWGVWVRGADDAFTRLICLHCYACSVPLISGWRTSV